MSSVKFDHKASGEEVRRITMQWDYANVPQAVLRKSKKKRERIEFPVPNWIKSLFDVAFTLLGVATTVFGVALALGYRLF